MLRQNRKSILVLIVWEEKHVTVHLVDIEHGIYRSEERCIDTMRQENADYVMEKEWLQIPDDPCFRAARFLSI